MSVGLPYSLQKNFKKKARKLVPEEEACQNTDQIQSNGNWILFYDVQSIVDQSCR